MFFLLLSAVILVLDMSLVSDRGTMTLSLCHYVTLFINNIDPLQLPSCQLLVLLKAALAELQ